MNKSGIQYSTVLATITVIVETYAAFFLDQGVHRIATGLGQAVILWGLSYWLFTLGAKRYRGPEIQFIALALNGAVCWVVSYQLFRIFYSSLGQSIAPVIVSLVTVGSISYFIGKTGGIGGKCNSEEAANK